ncbi:MAG TPA: hypothetical protein VML55_25260, partial [Planctomycetaceae bacterium]|nr:hypothetical protein [Planctomycetaceae bacterium]
QFFPRVLNQMQVGGLQQVSLKVRVMEVQRSKIRQLGFNFLYLTDDAFLVSTPGQLVQLSEILTPFGGPPGVGIAQNTLRDSTFVGGVVHNNSIFQGFLEALRQEGLLKILAEPELVATNGRPAHLLSGGEFPVLVPQSLGTVTIEWREFGVKLEAVPNILGRGRVRLDLEPEVSERDFANAVTVNGITVPGLTVRRANTQVEMKFGETFVIAGLLSTRNTAQTAKVPVLGELPWVGAAFRRVRYDEAETELVIMVTPELVAPLSCDQIPCGGPGLFSATPTDRELFIDGVLEVPFYGDKCINCAPHGACGPNGCGPAGCGPAGPGLVPGLAPLPAGPAIVPGSELYDGQPVVPPGPAAAPPGEARVAPPDRAEPFGPTETSLWGPANSPAPAGRAGRPAADEGGNPFAPSRPGLIEPQPGLLAPDGTWQPTRESQGLIAPTMR